MPWFARASPQRPVAPPASIDSLAIPIILWNNDSLAMIRDGMIKRGISQIGVNPKNPDFMNIAEGFGCRGIWSDSMASFAAAVDEALLAPVPTVIEVREDAGWLLWLPVLRRACTRKLVVQSPWMIRLTKRNDASIQSPPIHSTLSES